MPDGLSAARLPVSTADYLDAVEPYLRVGFVDQARFHLMSAIAATLPSPSAIGFEAHLGSSVPLQADFAVCFVSDGNPSYDILCGSHSSLDLSRDLTSHPVWKRIRSFLAGCRDPASPFYGISHNLWLEFDLESSAFQVPVPVPNVLFGLDVVPNPLPSVEAALEVLIGQPLPRPAASNLARCVHSAAPCAHIFQIGVMPRRGSDAVRVCVHGLSANGILDYLAAVRWPGDRRQVEAVLTAISPLVQTISLDLDVADTISSRLGLECYVLDHRVPEAPPEWQRFLAHLSTMKLCTPSQRDMLLRWPGYHSQRFVLPSVFVRGLSHVKLVCETGRPIKAKAYFGFVHSWTSRVGGPSYTTDALFGCPQHWDASTRQHP